MAQSGCMFAGLHRQAATSVASVPRGPRSDGWRSPARPRQAHTAFRLSHGVESLQRSASRRIYAPCCNTPGMSSADHCLLRCRDATQVPRVLAFTCVKCSVCPSAMVRPRLRVRHRVRRARRVQQQPGRVAFSAVQVPRHTVTWRAGGRAAETAPYPRRPHRRAIQLAQQPGRSGGACTRCLPALCLVISRCPPPVLC